MIPLLAALAVQAAAPAAPATPVAEEKKICRRVQVTGSNLPGRKTCRTRIEWASIDNANAAAAEAALQRRQNGGQNWGAPAGG